MKRRRISKAHYLCSLNVDREIVAVIGFMQNGGDRVSIGRTFELRFMLLD
ncbi:hypothetical protein ES706_04265 [subsurface metagenome]